MADNGAIKDRIKSLRRVNVSELQVHPKNPRKHAQGQRRAMSAALSEIGFADALLVRETDDGLQIIDGHLRADLAGDQKVPVLVLDVDEKEAEKLLATFDAITGLADIDEELLRSLTDGLEFETPELDELVAGLLGDEPAEIVEDDPLEAQDGPCVAQVGDVWACGRHRVVCGDSTDDATWPLEKADALITDPPYGIGKEYVDEYDDSISTAKYVEWVRRWINHAWRAVSGPKVIFTGVCHVGLWWQVRPPKWALCWLKMNGQSRNAFAGTNKWEPILVWDTPADHDIDVLNHGNEYNERIASDGHHPTPKPVKLLADLINRFGGRTVLDPFLGSGTTLIAAEQLGRTCYGIEIEPKYVDVILRRYMNFTNVSPRRERDGALFSELVKGEAHV